MAGGFLSASAQSFNISNECQSTLTTLATSSDGACLNLAGLLPLALAGSNTSLVDPINTWLGGLCSVDACNNDTLSTIVTNITQGCATDLQPLGFDPSAGPSVVSDVQQWYPTVRQVACLKDGSANQLCVTQTLTNLQSSTGTLSISGIIALVPNLLGGGFANIPKNETCTNCLKESYNLISQMQPNPFNSDAQSAISNQCGADFINGSQPEGLTETASGSSLAGQPGAAMKPFAVISSVMSVVGLASAFIVLA